MSANQIFSIQHLKFSLHRLAEILILRLFNDSVSTTQIYRVGRDGTMRANDELIKIWKEMVVTFSSYFQANIICLRDSVRTAG